MLRACVLDFKSGWHTYLPMANFACNNSFQASIGMALFEALYRRKYQSPIHRSEVCERIVLGPDVLREAEEKIRLASQWLLTVQTRQKSYANKCWRGLDVVGDRILLKASLVRVKWFGIREKLSLWYIGPYKILEHVGAMVYRLMLPPKLAQVHNVFHVSTLRKVYVCSCPSLRTVGTKERIWRMTSSRCASSLPRKTNYRIAWSSMLKSSRVITMNMKPHESSKLSERRVPPPLRQSKIWV